MQFFTKTLEDPPFLTYVSLNILRDYPMTPGQKVFWMVGMWPIDLHQSLYRTKRYTVNSLDPVQTFLLCKLFLFEVYSEAACACKCGVKESYCNLLEG